ncbi:DinB family protein [Nakamurella silvestris]|nr:DinB family protein [Nakamurella silvestris]
MSETAAASSESSTATPVAEPLAPVPDDKDWTWVLSRTCPECGFTGNTSTEEVAGLLLTTVDAWGRVLDRDDLGTRPSPQVWSPLEYACHVSDVYAVFSRRLALMLAEDNPEFANWDQDETALSSRYWERDPDEVARELRYNGLAYTQAYAEVSGDQWERGGRRSNGSVFTVHSQAIYGLHDIIHHLHDVGEPLAAG